MSGRRVNLVLWLMAAGYAFLYLPIGALIVYSFNASDRVTVWGGFSAKWYGALLENEPILNAAWLSLKIGLTAATFATVLGGLAGYAIARGGRFRGRTLFTGMTAAPLVMPDVITGLSLLLLFVAMEQAIGWPVGRSELTITIAHITFAMAFVAVVVQARVSQFDQAIEEAALDLGARPVRAFIEVTLPMIAPALASGWLLAFTLSLDDLVIASFVSGPGSSTLPIVVFSKVKLGLSPEINALAALIIAVASIAIILAAMASLRRGSAPR